MSKSYSIATSDTLTHVVTYLRRLKAQLNDACDLGILEYRVLAFLNEKGTGVAPKELAEKLGASLSGISICLKSLSERRLAEGYSPSALEAIGARALYRLTQKGADLVEECDGLLISFSETYYESLSREMWDGLCSGSVATTTYLGLTRMREGKYFSEYSILEGTLRNEQLFTGFAKAEGLLLGEFRVLLSLAEARGPLTQTQIREALHAHRSEASKWCELLGRKGLVKAQTAPHDKRTQQLRLTSEGKAKLTAVSEKISADALRPASALEGGFITKMFSIIVRSFPT